jgi:hypothetical protein
MILLSFPELLILISLHTTEVEELHAINFYKKKLGILFILSSFLKGIVSWDFDSIFTILSFSLEVKQLPLDILFFQFWCFRIKIISYMIFSA